MNKTLKYLTLAVLIIVLGVVIFIFASCANFFDPKKELHINSPWLGINITDQADDSVEQKRERKECTKKQKREGRGSDVEESPYD